MKEFKHLKILIYDIETAPLLGYVWSLWGNDVSLTQLKSDWHVLSWAAKWLGDPKSKIMYADQSKAKDVSNDKKILERLWKLLDEADVVITHNGKKFDQKRLNARFILNGMQPPSSVKHIDTCEIARKKFGFTSTKLEYLSNKLGLQKKSSHNKYPGFSLWVECLKGNKDAWKEMEKYNKIDVLALEEVYKRMSAWDNSIDFNVFRKNVDNVCNCGSREFRKSGFYYTPTGKYQKHKCIECGHEVRERENLLTKEKRKSLQAKVV